MKKLGISILDIILGATLAVFGCSVVYNNFFKSTNGYNFNDNIGKSYTEVIDRVENFKYTGIIEEDEEGNEFKIFYDVDTLLVYRRIELDKMRCEYQEILGTDKKPMNLYEYKQSRRIFDDCL